MVLIGNLEPCRVSSRDVHAYYREMENRRRRDIVMDG